MTLRGKCLHASVTNSIYDTHGNTTSLGTGTPTTLP
jgi:hypothetical protein